MFNNNSAQVLQNQQQTRYQTRQSEQNNSSSQNIFSNQSNSNNIFSGSQNNNQNVSNNQSNSQNIFSGNQNRQSNIFSNNTQNNQNIFSNNSSSQNNANIFSTSQPVNSSQGNNQQNNMQMQYMQYSQQQELLNALTKIHDLQKDGDLYKLTELLKKVYEKAEATINRAQKEGEVITKESTEKAIKLRKDIKERCMAIKQKNSLVLQNMLNLRQKLTHQAYHYKIRNANNELEMERLVEKIRQTSSEIKNKKNQLNLQRQFNMNAPKRSEPQKFKTITRPLVELRTATEKLGRELMQYKIQFELLSRYLRGQSIDS